MYQLSYHQYFIFATDALLLLHVSAAVLCVQKGADQMREKYGAKNQANAASQPAMVKALTVQRHEIQSPEPTAFQR